MSKDRKAMTEMLRLRVTKEQRTWMDHKATEMTQDIGRDVPYACVLRALVDREMDRERLLGKVWDED